MTRELVVRTPDGRSKTVNLDGDRLSIGRSTNNDLCYTEDAGLSRQHLVLERDGDDWLVRDLGSKNGTMVNGERIVAAQRLRPGDRITVGHLVILFDDPFGGIAESVVFVDAPQADVPASSTVIARLENLLGETPPEQRAAQAMSFIDTDIRVKALIHAGRELAGHRPLADLFPLILDLALDAVDAERGVLLTLEGDNLVVRAARGESFRISSAVRDRVVNQRSSLLVRDAMNEDAFRERVSIQQHNVRGMMAVPLQTSDRVIGLVYIDSPNLMREFTREDLNLLTVMANVAAIRLEHARLSDVEQAERIMARDLEQAAEIQRRLLPEKSPEVPGLDLAGYNAPCRTVGGDYYDFFTCSDGRVAIVVADVSGKGMPAALLMSSLQARVQVLADDPSDVGALVAKLNRLLCANIPSNRFISLFLGVLDPATGELAYCNAGHNPPVLIRADGQIEWLHGGGPILGILSKAPYEEKRSRIGPGEFVVLYSDGVTEMTDPGNEEFGEQRLAQVLAGRRAETASALVDAVRAELSQFAAGANPADDLTLVVAKRTNT
jgi:serine phosphatase RsbU (regulator of sigma subunit)